ncbi:MAG: AmmeMemoRadiSam system protein A [Planctomycetota bacterium]|jgi:AmmeMemoRadiSam system protein A
MPETKAPLTEEEGQQALKLARYSLESHVTSNRGGTAINPAYSDGLNKHLGAFVTIHTSDGMLRGCIGHMIGQGPLHSELSMLAVAAGTQDPRFPPVLEAELPELSYEVSVLSEMSQTVAEDVVAGVHGLMIKNGVFSGVLLPQVAQDHGWDRVTFLEQTCQKAGLPKDAWTDPNTVILTFTAQVFSE